MTDWPIRGFYFTAAALTFLLIALAWNAPISGDEEVHVRQAEKNLDFYLSMGQDRRALDTPINHLKHYGQSFDNFTTGLIRVFGVDDVYRFRHVSNALIAGLIVLLTGLLVIELGGSKWAGILSMILLVCSPRFTGHALNNLKDVPFSLGYILALYALVVAGKEWPRPTLRSLLLFVAGAAFAISIRIGGLLTICYLWLYAALLLYRQYHELKINGNGSNSGVNLAKFTAGILVLSMLAYLLGLLFWPWGLTDPLRHPFDSLALMHNYPTSVRQVFAGRLYWSEDFPWYYIGKYILISSPLAVLTGLVLLPLSFRRIFASDLLLPWLMVGIAVIFPLFYTAASGANVYGGWRQLLFVYPAIAAISACGFWYAFQRWRNIGIRIAIAFMLLALMVQPIRHMLVNHPFHYIYFNNLAGGVRGAYGNYELDYYFTAYREAYEWLWKRLETFGEADQALVVSSNFIIREYYRDRPQVPLLIDYYHRSESDWDYAVICGTFLYPEQLKQGFWPPQNTIYEVRVDGRPIAVVLKRHNKLDLDAFRALKRGDYASSIALHEAALSVEPRNESALLHMAGAQIGAGKLADANYFIDQLERFCPGNGWVNALRAEERLARGEREEAVVLLMENIAANKKFYHSYVALARLYLDSGEREKAKQLIQTCLWYNPFYRDANLLMADMLQVEGLKTEAEEFRKRAR